VDLKDPKETTTLNYPVGAVLYSCEAINVLFFGEDESESCINEQTPAEELMEIIDDIRTVNNHTLRQYTGDFGVRFLPKFK